MACLSGSAKCELHLSYAQCQGSSCRRVGSFRPQPLLTSTIAADRKGSAGELGGVTVGTGGNDSRSFVPIYALPHWKAIGPFVHASVADTLESGEREAGALYSAASAFVLWCWQSKALPLTRTRIFRHSLVEEFVHLAMQGYVRGSRATMRSSLQRMLEALNPSEALLARRPIPRSLATVPYSPAEVAELHSWAQGQATSNRRRDALALLVLGLGAGLVTRELLEVTANDFHHASSGLVVTIRTGRIRTTPVLAEWQRTAERVLSEVDADKLFFRPGRSGSHSGQVADFMQRARTTLDVRPMRMRATWLLHHLEQGTPPRELLRISGLKHLAALDKAIQYAPRTGGMPIW